MKKVTITKSAGFCFGVKRALQLAGQTASKYKKVYMLGDIVHNPRVVQDIKKAGIIKIDSLRKQHKGILLIRAHGAARQVYNQAAEFGYKIVDATCPMVKEIHSIARQYEDKKYSIIIIGEKTHDEVIGIKGNLNTKPLIISKKTEITSKKFSRIKKAAIVVQSTQNLEKVMLMVDKIEKHIKNVIFCNTICHPTRLKQKEIQSFPKTQDVMIIIGAKNSANTKRLYELSKSINPNTYLVNSKNELRKKWFKNKEKIGIGAGASTPEYIIKEISSYIRQLD